MTNDSAGIGDPYWYEWSVGLDYILTMLDPASGITGVTLQASDVQGLDDIVVRYSNGSRTCIQVKHTREDDSLTFGDLVTAGAARRDGTTKPSLLKALATAWNAARSQTTSTVRAELHTNRAVGRRAYSRIDSEIQRPALSEFWPLLKREASNRGRLDEVELPEDYQTGWSEWRSQLTELPEDQRIEFVRSLTINAGAPDLNETEANLVAKLATLIGCTTDQAQDLLASLDHALRGWVTSRRSREEVQLEDVLEALRLKADSVGTTHLIAPPEPFFPSREQLVSNITSELRIGSSPIAFLTGAPGAGKTSVISALSAREDRVVDIRFHAYRPVTPDDSRLPPDSEVDLSALGLWGDLLAQLRDQLHGQLADYHVPVRNGLLDHSQRRAHVLRIANAIGTSRGAPFIIAIDGIDHAVRAKTSLADSFLQSLPSPAEIPDHVRLLVGGQTPEAWPEYPAWLRQGTAGVQRFNVPGLEESDVRALLKERVRDGLDDADTTCRLVLDASGGETLPTIFAVEEARLATSLDDLSARLSNRSLASGLQAYYDEIWGAVSDRLNSLRPFLADRAALALAFWDQRIDGNMLGGAFAEVDVPPADWRSCLLELRPLIVEEDGKFRAAHNDVRLFFASEYNADPQRYVTHLSSLADYALREAANSKFSLAFQLLGLAGRSDEYPKHFTNDFVIEGWRSGVSIERLAWHAREALRCLALHRDWQLVLSVVCALITLRQIEASCQTLGFIPHRTSTESAATLPALSSECRVTPRSSWTPETIDWVIGHVLELAHAGQRRRARGLFRRWFRGMTPPEINVLLRGEGPDHFHEEVGGSLSGVGQAAEACGLRPPSTEIETDDLGPWADFYAGFVDHAIDSGGLRRWYRAFDSIRAYSRGWLQEHLDHLADAERWTELAIALRTLGNRTDAFAAVTRVQFAALAILTEVPAVAETWARSVDADPFDCATDFSDSRDRANAVTLASFVVGARSLRPIEAIRDDAASAFGTYGRRDTPGQVAFLSLVAAAVGRWLARPSEQPPISESELGRVLERLAERPRGYELHGFQDRLSGRLFRLLAEAVRRSGIGTEVLRDFCHSFLESGETGPAIRSIWAHLVSCGETAALERWFARRLSLSGSFWFQTTSERLEELALLSELANSARLTNLFTRIDLLRRDVSFGYTDHKDYNLAEPLEWFRSLSREDPTVWENLGLEVLALSMEAEITGDNRLALGLESSIGAAAARCGPSALGMLEAAKLGKHRWFEPSTKFWVGALAEALEDLEVTESDLLAIWSAAIGCLSWQHHTDLEYLRELRAALTARATKDGLTSFSAAVEGVTQLEWSFASETARTTLYGLWYQVTPAPDGEDVFAEFAGLDLEPAIELFRRRITERPRELRRHRAAQRLAKRLLAERPLGAMVLAQQLLDIWLIGRDQPEWPWRIDGTDQVLEQLIPLLPEAYHWRLLADVVRRLDSEPDDQVPTSACRELDLLCRRRSLDESWLRFGAERHVATQASWIPSSRELPRPALPESVGFSTWQGYSVAASLRRLTSDSMLLSHAALRGLGALLQLVPATADELCRTSIDVGWEDAVAIGGLFEYIAAISAPLRPAVVEWLNSCSKRTQLACELQTWVVRCTAASSAPPELRLVRSDDGRPKLPETNRLVVESRAIRRSSYSAIDTQAAVAMLPHLEAIGAPVAAIESLLAESLRSSPPPKADRERLSRPGDAIFQPGGQRTRLLEILRAIVSGETLPTSPVRLVQTVLDTDEPRVLFGNWCSTNAQWPLDYELDSLIEKDQKQLTAVLQELLNLNLARDEEVIAGSIASFSKAHEVYLFRAPIHRPPSDVVEPRPNPTTIGGRTFLFRDPLRFESTRAEGSRWLWLRARGLGRWPSQTLGLVPNAWLQREELLAPSPSDPLIWRSSSGRVVRYERIYGPQRDTVLDRAFNVPYLERWVCSPALRLELEGFVSGTVQLVDELELFKTDFRD